VQPVRKLHHDDAHVVHHGQQHLPDVFGLARFGSQQVQPVDFRDPFDERGDVRPEAFGDALRGHARVLDHVVQKRGAERRDVQLHVRQDVRDFQGMRKVRVARLAQLRAVLLGGKIERPPQELNVARGARLPHFFDQLEEAHLQGLGRALRLAADADQRRESYGLFQRRHVPVFYVYLMPQGRKEFRACPTRAGRLVGRASVCRAHSRTAKRKAARCRAASY
jgi:hypothetical protein